MFFMSLAIICDAVLLACDTFLITGDHKLQDKIRKDEESSRELIYWGFSHFFRLLSQLRVFHEHKENRHTTTSRTESNPLDEHKENRARDHEPH